MIKYLILLISMSSCILITAEPEKKLCGRGQCGRERNACSCYCSIKCGPREIMPEDTPKYDEEDGQCFCRPRDKALYRKNSCDVRKQSK